MPLTIAHPAIILPFRKIGSKWFSISGLIIGSMSPDFEYLLTFQLQDEIAHSSLGVLLFCLPIGLLIYCVYHGLIRVPLIRNFPRILKNRFFYASDFNWKLYFPKRWFVICYSLVLGAFSHLFWDAFTHEHRFFVEHFPVLKSTIGNFPIYKLLQHLSTLFGIVFILFSIYKLPTRMISVNPQNWIYWLICFFTMSVVFFIRFQFGLSIKHLGNIVVTGFSAFFIGLLIASVLDVKTGVFRKGK